MDFGLAPVLLAAQVIAGVEQAPQQPAPAPTFLHQKKMHQTVAPKHQKNSKKDNPSFKGHKNHR